MESKSRMPIRVPLVILQLAVAVLLSWIGAKQTNAKAVQNQNSVPWDYSAPAKTILHSINFPATIATGLLTNDGLFASGLEQPWWRLVLYLCCIAALWYTVGFCVDRGYSKSVATMKKPFVIAGLIGALFLLVVAVLLIGGPSATVLLIAAFLWSGFLLYFFGKLLMKGRRPPLGAAAL